MPQVPSKRIRALNRRVPRDRGRYVLYWMLTNRRPHWNFALDHAIARARHHRVPLLVVETLRADYPWASDRLHRFMLQDMAANAEAFAASEVRFLPFVERPGMPQHGLVEALAQDACEVVSDDYPILFVPAMVAEVADAIDVRLEVVDSMGLLPMRAADRAYPSAYQFRRFLQKALPDHLSAAPAAGPLRRAEDVAGAQVRKAVLERWPIAPAALLAAGPGALAELPIDHDVGPALFQGGWRRAHKHLRDFIGRRFQGYSEDRNHPDSDAASGLSPYLHFGHLSAHQAFDAVVAHEDWEPGRLAQRSNGAREGWWGMSKNAEAFLDEMITWRELGQNTAVFLGEDFDKYHSLPDWALATLDEHRGDVRPHTYSLAEFARAETHDPVWNAAQRQLRDEGRLHNYMRMLWGKKILEWSRTPEDALAVLIELNNKYAVDGRDPNSYAGIFWILGRYDRPWPSHDVFGKVRCMTSNSTQRKLNMKQYLKAYGSRP